MLQSIINSVCKFATGASFDHAGSMSHCHESDISSDI